MGKRHSRLAYHRAVTDLQFVKNTVFKGAIGGGCLPLPQSPAQSPAVDESALEMAVALYETGHFWAWRRGRGWTGRRDGKGLNLNSDLSFLRGAGITTLSVGPEFWNVGFEQRATSKPRGFIIDCRPSPPRMAPAPV